MAVDFDYDRTSTNANGTVFYGVDNGDGTTSWYDKDGCYDSDTRTPTDWEQEMEDNWNPSWNGSDQMDDEY